MEYILTEGGNILSRIILLSFVIVHCFVGYCNGVFRFYVPPRLYHGFFITEFVALTAFVVWCCINEPFKDGVFPAVVGYVFVYLCWLCCYVLLRHLMINPSKVYRMIPYRLVNSENKVGVGGCILAGGWSHEVVVYDEKLQETACSKTPIMVKFKRYSNASQSFAAVMEQVDEQKTSDV